MSWASWWLTYDRIKGLPNAAKKCSKSMAISHEEQFWRLGIYRCINDRPPTTTWTKNFGGLERFRLNLTSFRGLCSKNFPMVVMIFSFHHHSQPPYSLLLHQSRWTTVSYLEANHRNNYNFHPHKVWWISLVSFFVLQKTSWLLTSFVLHSSILWNHGWRG